MDATTISIVAAFAAGALSFLSPCCLPLVPGYLAVVSPPTDSEPGRLMASPSAVRIALFLVGFCSVFVMLGVTASALGQQLAANRTELSLVAGSGIAFMGLLMLRPAGLAFPFLSGPAAALGKRTGNSAPLLAGAGFAVAWTPCIGPVLAGVLAMSATADSARSGAALLAIYALGLSIPFVMVGIAFSRVHGRLRRLARARRLMRATGGALLIGMGLLVASDTLFLVNIAVQRTAASWGVDVWQLL